MVAFKTDFLNLVWNPNLTLTSLMMLLFCYSLVQILSSWTMPFLYSRMWWTIDHQVSLQVITLSPSLLTYKAPKQLGPSHPPPPPGGNNFLISSQTLLVKEHSKKIYLYFQDNLHKKCISYYLSTPTWPILSRANNLLFIAYQPINECFGIVKSDLSNFHHITSKI